MRAPYGRLTAHGACKAGATIVLEDAGLVLTQAPGTGCTVGSSGHQARCPAAGTTKVVVSDTATTMFGKERFTAAAAFPLRVEIAVNRSMGPINAPALTGGAGDDQLVTCSLCGSAITGNGGNDSITGGAGRDIVTPGAGRDVVQANGGFDVVRYDDPARTAGVRVDLTGSGPQGGPDDGPAGGGDTLVGFEGAVGTPFDDRLAGCASPASGSGGLTTACQGLAGDDVLTGSAGAEQLAGGDGLDTLIGAGGDDVLLGGDGDDVLRGGMGADDLLGGAGLDSADYSDYAQAVTVAPPTSTTTCVAGGNAAEGQDRWGPRPGTACPLEVERVLGGAGGDTITIAGQAGPTPTADGGPITLTGATGAGVLGGSGDDILTTGPGSDSLDGGPGRDRLDAGAGDDALDARDGEADALLCGPGADTIDVDAVDSLDQCELPPPPPPSTPPSTTDPGTTPPPPAITPPSDGEPVPAPIGARLKQAVRATTRATEVATLTVKAVPGGGKVVVTCKARPRRACAFASRTLTVKGSAPGTVRLAPLFERRKLPVGTVITITVSAPSRLSPSTRLTVRKGKDPTRRITCTTPAGAAASC